MTETQACRRRGGAESDSIFSQVENAPARRRLA